MFLPPNCDEHGYILICWMRAASDLWSSSDPLPLVGVISPFWDSFKLYLQSIFFHGLKPLQEMFPRTLFCSTLLLSLTVPIAIVHGRTSQVKHSIRPFPSRCSQSRKADGQERRNSSTAAFWRLPVCCLRSNGLNMFLLNEHFLCIRDCSQHRFFLTVLQILTHLIPKVILGGIIISRTWQIRNLLKVSHTANK